MAVAVALGAALVAGPTIDIPAPLPHQEAIVASPARFKVAQWGRRAGKTVVAENFATVGHGPPDPKKDGEPRYKGIAQGFDVLWVARDHTQSSIVWHEFFEPRFKGVPGVKVNQQERSVSIIGAGTIFLVSAENIASVRGVGKNLGGAVVEEAAWMDLAGALRDVLLPALMDNEGWLLLISTTNAGPDGGRDDAGQPRVPSYFNTICEEIRAGLRSNDWERFEATASDNPRISKQAFADLCAEYTQGSAALEQEVHAKLLKGGVGVALPLLDAKVHLIPRIPPGDFLASWRHFGAIDWGWNHPWSFGWYIADEDGNVAKVETVTGRQDEPEQIGDKVIAAGVPLQLLRVIYAGHDIFDKKGTAIGYKGPTIAEKLRKKGMRLIKANTNRVLGLNNLRAFTYFERDDHGAIVTRPRLVFFDTPGNRACLIQLQRMQVDPKNLEDALKVDADHQGRGGDDTYDETRYGMMSRYRSIKAVDPAVVPQDHVKQIDYRKGEFIEPDHAADDIIELGGQAPRRGLRVHVPRVSHLRGNR
jgi:hypothetical protein